MRTNLFTVLVLLILASCNGAGPVTEPKDMSSETGDTDNGAGTVTQGSSQSVLRVKNYNQYNMTLEKLTEINRSNYNSLFESIKGSLPADNDIGGMTPFNLIAMTRLADAYCVDYIEAKSAQDLDLSPFVVANVRDYLFNKFLDYSDKDEKFTSLKNEVDNVLQNEDASGAELFPNVTNDLNGNKSLAVAACVTILASPYITLLE